MKRKYSVVVSSHINCSSSGHYHATVVIQSNRRDVRYYDLMNKQLLVHRGAGYFKGYPQYVMVEIYNQLNNLLDNGDIRVYEYDGDGNERYENLRYHRQDHLTWLIQG